MQWETVVRFCGQVKPAGIEKSMNWKTGSVHFDKDAVSGLWMAKLYFKVNPTKVCQQMKIGQSDSLDIKCGRLMIENKKGDGIHIKLSNNDVANARILVSKIKSSTVSTPTNNKAVVGLTSNPTISSHKGSENVNPFIGEDSNEWSLLQSRGDISPERQVGGWLSKKTPPMKNREHNPVTKRKLELFSPERRDENRKDEQQSFTGMKDYSKRNLNGGNSLSVTNGLGANSFYGAQNTLANNNAYRNSHLDNSSRSLDRSPLNKRLKLSSVSEKNRSNKMRSSRNYEASSSSSSVAQYSGDSTLPLESSGYYSDTPVRHHLGEQETIGFQNLGNTCFLNSPLQCMSSLEPLALDIQSSVAKYGSDLNSKSVTRKLYLLMKNVRKHDVCPNSVKDMLVELRRDMIAKFAENTQQDAHELLSELLNRVDEEVKAAIRCVSPTPYMSALDTASLVPTGTGEMLSGNAAAAALPSITTPTESNFCWSYRTHMYFHECKTEVMSSQTEHEMTLMLALDNETHTIQDCIRKYFESTEVEMKCEKCDKDEKATITRKIVRRPRVFILTLLRYHSTNMKSTKKADHISIPSYISVLEYCAEDVKRPPHVDPFFMIDRNLPEPGLTWHDYEEECKCSIKNLPSSAAKTETKGSVKTCHVDRLPQAPPENDFENMTEQLVPGSRTNARVLTLPIEMPNYSDRAFGQLSGDTDVTVHHSDAFISVDLNAPLDYSHRSDGGANQHLPSFHIFKTPYPSRRPFEEASGADMQRYQSAFNRRIGIVDQNLTMNLDEDSGPKIHKLSVVQDLDLLSTMVTLSSSNLKSLDECMTAARRTGKHFAQLNDCAQAIILAAIADAFRDVQDNSAASRPRHAYYASKASTDVGQMYQQYLAVILMKQAFNLSETEFDASREDVFNEVIQCMIVARYDAVLKRDKCLGHLIDDIALFISATQLDLLRHHEQKDTTKSLKEERHSSRGSDFEVDIESEVSGAQSSAVQIPQEKILRLRRTKSSRHVEVEKLNDNLEKDAQENFYADSRNCDVSGAQSSADQIPQEKILRLRHVEKVNDNLEKDPEENFYADDSGNCDNFQNSKFAKERANIDGARSSLSASSGSIWDQSQDVTSQLIYDVDVSSYSEDQLSKINTDSLTEDEIMIYITALSKYQYEKDTAAKSTHSKIKPFGKGSSSTRLDDIRDVSEEKVYGSSSRTNPQSHRSLIHPYERPTAAVTGSNRRFGFQSGESNLVCQEENIDYDEIDGQYSQLSHGQSYKVLDISQESSLVPDIDNATSGELTISSTSGLAAVSALDQTDYSHHLDTSYSVPEENVVSAGRASEKQLSPPKVSKCDKSHSSSEGSESDIVNISDEIEAAVYSSMQSPEEASNMADKNDSAVPQSSNSDRKECFSLSKTINLVKTRDYARLKSPASSPKKRMSKGDQCKSLSLSKRLHFSGENQTEKVHKSSSPDESLSSEEGSESELLDSSLEVNVDDESFVDSMNSCSFVDPSALNISQSTLLAAPKLNTNAPAKVSTSNIHEPRASSLISTVQQLPPQTSDTQDDQFATTVPSSRARKDSIGENIQEDIELKNALNVSFKSNRPVSSSVSSLEKKNQSSTEIDRANHARDIALGKADLSYKLVGVVDHTGNSQFTGHYTAYAFNMKKQLWFYLNDHETKMVTEEEVLENNTETGYLFFIWIGTCSMSTKILITLHQHRSLHVKSGFFSPHELKCGVCKRKVTAFDSQQDWTSN